MNNILKYNNKNNLIIENFNEKINKTLLINSKKNFNKVILMEKQKLLQIISKYVKKNLTSVKSIFIGRHFNFGNYLIIMYKTLFFCKILGCRKIILNKNYIWFIKNKIINRKDKISIEIKNEPDLKYFDIIIDKTWNFYYYKGYLNPEFKINILRKEIIKNLPKISIYNNELYIYIRSGDIFIKPHFSYSQPPFCFYKKVLEKFLFKKIYLIAENKSNPVINKLLNVFPNIIYNINSIKIDITYLVYAYNIVGGATSTFLSNILRLNNNLKCLWSFQLNTNILNNYIKLNLINNLKKIKIYLMYTSNNYKKKMKYWKNDVSQRNLMINETCINTFTLINKDKTYFLKN